MSMHIPIQAWSRRMDQELDTPGKPALSIPLKMLFKMFPAILRIRRNAKKQAEAGFDPMNAMGSAAPGEGQGVPLGGLGCGSIGRGWRGDFSRWQLRPGYIHHGTVHADQFSLYVKRDGEDPCSTTLSPVKPGDVDSLKGWNWGLQPSRATYHALFPRAWTVFDEPLPGIRLTSRQVSPFIPGDYRNSSFPQVVFIWNVENTGKNDAEVGLMFSFQNGSGLENDSAGGHHNQPFALPMATGVELRHIHRQVKARAPADDNRTPLQIIEDDLAFAIAVKKSPGLKISTKTRFLASGSGEDLWSDFSESGMLKDNADLSPSQKGENIGGAVAARIKLKAGKSTEIAFSLSWDMPRIHFGFGRAHLRRYSVFYGAKGTSAPKMARDALMHYPEWEKKIEAWQKPILTNLELPDWYKSALFNELYYLVDGGTIWAYPESQKPDEKNMGHFAYLESHDYRMYNTYDVHFYSSIALTLLFPKIELSLQEDFASTVDREIPMLQVAMMDGAPFPRKVCGAIPHDLGCPDEDPWYLINGYNFHDSSRWKDLNPKFVLQVYRDYVLTDNRKFLRKTWPAVEQAMEYMIRYDRDGDGLIENDGIPDQTYDAWSVSGPSAYTGCLWLASLLASSVMARQLGYKKHAMFYEDLYMKGHGAYEEKLWNGSYYDYDGSSSRQHDSIMADALAGYWFARSADLSPVLQPERVHSMLGEIFRKNVMGIKNGSVGAMNGVRPSGRIDRTSLQSQEVWTGTTYALAANMIQEGMIEEAFKTAWGIYHMTYEKMGYWFQTPEAWMENGNYRAIAYMRPLAIWAMQYAWQKRKTNHKKIAVK